MLKKLFIKYVIGECRHICKLCSYRNECDINYIEISWKYLWKYFKLKRERIKKNSNIKSIKEEMNNGSRH